MALPRTFNWRFVLTFHFIIQKQIFLSHGMRGLHEIQTCYQWKLSYSEYSPRRYWFLIFTSGNLQKELKYYDLLIWKRWWKFRLKTGHNFKSRSGRLSWKIKSFRLNFLGFSLLLTGPSREFFMKAFQHFSIELTWIAQVSDCSLLGP